MCKPLSGHNLLFSSLFRAGSERTAHFQGDLLKTKMKPGFILSTLVTQRTHGESQSLAGTKLRVKLEGPSKFFYLEFCCLQSNSG